MERLLILEGLATKYQDFLTPSELEELEELSKKNQLQALNDKEQNPLSCSPEEDYKIWKALQF